MQWRESGDASKRGRHEHSGNGERGRRTQALPAKSSAAERAFVWVHESGRCTRVRRCGQAWTGMRMGRTDGELGLGGVLPALLAVAATEGDKLSKVHEAVAVGIHLLLPVAAKTLAPLRRVGAGATGEDGHDGVVRVTD